MEAQGSAVTYFAGKVLLRRDDQGSAEGGVDEGYLALQAGRVVDYGLGECPERPAARGWIVPAPVNAHTHVADTFLRDVPGKPAALPELVGPGGWKATRLAQASPDTMAAGVHRIAEEMAAVGTSLFIDFREQGVPGATFLHALGPELAVEPCILGRPRDAAAPFDPDEATQLLEVAAGLGLSALRDFPDPGVAIDWVEAARRARRAVALHASEGVREDIDAILALEPDLLVHTTRATPGDWEETAQAGVPVAVCPRSNARFGLRPNVPGMLAAGLTVAVGTDNGMLGDGNILAELAQLRAWHPRLPLATLLRLATWNGREAASAVGRSLPLAWPPKRGGAPDLLVLPEDPLPATFSPQATKPGFVVAGPPIGMTGPGAPPGGRHDHPRRT